MILMFRECERVAHTVAAVVMVVCMSACLNNVAQVMDSELDQFDQIEMNINIHESVRDRVYVCISLVANKKYRMPVCACVCALAVD